MKNIKRFDVVESKSILVGQTGLLWSYTVPPDAIAKIKKFGNSLLDPDAWGFAYWTIKRNGVPIEAPYDKIFDQLGFASMLKEINIDDFNGGDLIEVYATNEYIDPLGIGLLMVVEVI